MLSITVTCCTNIHILIRSPLKIKFLHLLWKFHSYIFHGLGEFKNCDLQYSQSTLIKITWEIFSLTLRHSENRNVM